MYSLNHLPSEVEITLAERLPKCSIKQLKEKSIELQIQNRENRWNRNNMWCSCHGNERIENDKYIKIKCKVIVDKIEKEIYDKDTKAVAFTSVTSKILIKNNHPYFVGQGWLFFCIFMFRV